MALAFDECNKRGKHGEKRVCDRLIEHGCKVQMRPNASRHRRDIYAEFPNGEPVLIEVKNEDNFANGNNVCFEIRQKGRPSGLMTSESTVLIHTLGDKCLVCRTQPLRNWLLERIASGKSRVRAVGDNQNEAVLESQLLVAMQPFADLIDFAALPNSKVFKPVVEEQDPERFDGLS